MGDQFHNESANKENKISKLVEYRKQISQPCITDKHLINTLLYNDK